MTKVLGSLMEAKQMPAVGAAAMRLYVNLSANQYSNLKAFLAAASCDYQYPSLDCLPNLKYLRVEDDASLPSNVSYTIKDLQGNVIYSNDAEVLQYFCTYSSVIKCI